MPPPSVSQPAGRPSPAAGASSRTFCTPPPFASVSAASHHFVERDAVYEAPSSPLKLVEGDPESVVEVHDRSRGADPAGTAPADGGFPAAVLVFPGLGFGPSLALLGFVRLVSPQALRFCCKTGRALRDSKSAGDCEALV